MNLYRFNSYIVRIRLNDDMTLCYYKNTLSHVEKWDDKFLPSTKGFWDV